MPPENDEVTNSQVPETEVDTGMVDVHDAKMEDLDAALKNAVAEEGVTNPEPGAEVEPPVQQDPQKPIEQGEGQKPEPIATQGANPANPARTYTEEEVQGLLAKNARNGKEGTEKEPYIQKRNQELSAFKERVSTSRQALLQARAHLETGLEERFSENPAQAIEDRDRIKNIDAQLGTLDEQEDKATRIVEAQTFFLRHVDTEKVSLDDVADVLKADGLDERYVAHFKENPWEFTTPEALVQMGKRAIERKFGLQADSDRKVLANGYLALKAENEKLRGKPAQVMQTVQRHLSAPAPITAASSSSPKNARDLDPTKMSLPDLHMALRNAEMH